MRFWEAKVIEGNPKVRVVAACYLDEPRKFYATACFINSMLAQTYQNFEVFVVHDGPLAATPEKEKLLSLVETNKEKIKFFETEERLEKSGYPHRRKYALLDQNFDWLLMTNSDNYYVPVFLEALLGAADSPEVKIVYTDMVHSHTKWKSFITSLTMCGIDLGAFMVTREVINAIDFSLYGDCFTADGFFVEKMRSKYHKHDKKAEGLLFIHN